MNTPAHLIFGMTAFGRPGEPKVTGAALAGALLPDLSLYLLAGWHLYVLQTPPRVVFGELYFSEGWQSLFRIDNSIILWGLLLVLGLMVGRAIVIAFAGAGLLHLVLDLLLHHDDGRAHFWPFSDWIFQSPVSYWDPAHYGGIVGPLEIGLSLICCVFLWRRFQYVGTRLMIAAFALAEGAPVIIWAVMFSGG